MNRQHDDTSVFTPEDSGNFFYRYSEDHSKDFLFDDDLMLSRVLQRSDPLSEEYDAVSALTGRSGAYLLRSLKNTPFMIRENCFQNMEKEKRNSARGNRLRLRVFYDYCDAIGFFSEEEKGVIRKKKIRRNVVRIFCVLSAVCAVIAALAFALNPHEIIRPRHVYGYGYGYDYDYGYDYGKTIRKADVEIYQDRVRRMTIYDDKENPLVSLSAEENSWGRHLTVSAKDPDNGAVTTVSYDQGGPVPVSVRQQLPDGLERETDYNPESGIMFFLSETDTEHDQLMRRISYRDDGTIGEIQIYDENGGMLCYSLHPTLEYSYRTLAADNTRSTWCMKPDGSVCSGRVEKTIDDRTFLVEEYGKDRSLTCIQLSLDGREPGKSAFLSVYPSDQALLVPPAGETEYDEAGRVQKISWGPTCFNQDEYYSYFYREDGQLEKIEYHTMRGEYDRHPLTTAFLLDAGQHIVEIVDKNNLMLDEHVFFTYGDNGKIQSADVYTMRLRDGQQALANHQTYHYNDRDQLEFVSIDLMDLEGSAVLYFGPDGSVVNAVHSFDDQ